MIIRIGICALLITTTGRCILAADTEQLARLKQVVVERRCYELYFQGSAMKEELGTSRPLKIVFEGSRFYASIDPAGFVGPNHQPWRLNYIGKVDGDRISLVTKNYEPDLEEKFARSPVVQDTLTMPIDCQPHYEPSTPEKERMLEKVVQAVQRQLLWAAKHPTEGQPLYPGETKVTVADFNVDYPYAYVLVEEPRKVFSVALHDPNDADEEAYQAGDYWVGEEMGKEKLARMIPRIRAHGIVRTIVSHAAEDKRAARGPISALTAISGGGECRGTFRRSEQALVTMK